MRLTQKEVRAGLFGSVLVMLVACIVCLVVYFQQGAMPNDTLGISHWFDIIIAPVITFPIAVAIQKLAESNRTIEFPSVGAIFVVIVFPAFLFAGIALSMAFFLGIISGLLLLPLIWSGLVLLYRKMVEAPQEQ
jgi:hypothetical protein